MKDTDVHKSVRVCLAESIIILVGEAANFRGLIVTQAQENRRGLTQGLDIHPILVHERQPGLGISVLRWKRELVSRAVI
jgi:hypothetical protein